MANRRWVITTSTFISSRFLTTAAEVTAITSPPAITTPPTITPPYSPVALSTGDHAIDAAIESEKKGRLFHYLKGCKGDVMPVLTNYVNKGIRIEKHYLINCIKDLRKYNRIREALQVYEWMNKSGFDLSSSDFAIRMGLLSKKDGIASCEAFFDSLPSACKDKNTYGALLFCYCNNMMEDKALALFSNMKPLGYHNFMTYESLILLHMRLGQLGKVHPLVREMKRKRVPLRSFTYNCLLNSCAQLGQMAMVEKIVKKIAMNLEVWRDWSIHSNLAAIYVKQKLFKEAESSLATLERLAPRDRRAFHYMITLYTATSNLEAVHRVWFYLKECCPMNNKSAMIMLQALADLNSVDGFKRLFDGWESSCAMYDCRFAYVAIKAYLKWDMLEEAEGVFGTATKRSSGPFSRIRALFVEYFLQKRKISIAMKHMKSAVCEGRRRKWQPDPNLVSEFLVCLDEKNDVVGADKLRRMLKMGGSGVVRDLVVISC